MPHLSDEAAAGARAQKGAPGPPCPVRCREHAWPMRRGMSQDGASACGAEALPGVVLTSETERCSDLKLRASNKAIHFDVQIGSEAGGGPWSVRDCPWRPYPRLKPGLPARQPDR